MTKKEQPATKQRDFVRKESKGNSNATSGIQGQTYVLFLKNMNEAKSARRHLSAKSRNCTSFNDERFLRPELGE